MPLPWLDDKLKMKIEDLLYKYMLYHEHLRHLLNLTHLKLCPTDTYLRLRYSVWFILNKTLSYAMK